MRVVVFGATGNVGTSVVGALRRGGVEDVVGVARRVPGSGTLGIEWQSADIARDDLTTVLADADVAVHLAWALHPTHDPGRLHEVNVVGSARLLDAVAAAGVGALVYASSIGAYSPGPKDRPVDEGWPTDGIPTSLYSRQKAYVERLLDRFELANPDVRVVRLRPGLILKAEAGAEIHRLFLGRLFPRRLLAAGRVPVVPDIAGLVLQAVHADDAAEAYRLAVAGRARGAFNIAAEPALTPTTLAKALGAWAVPVPAGLVRAAARLTWSLRLQPTDPGWIDMALEVPRLDVTRARTELGWTPTRTSIEAVRELLEGMGSGRDFPTPALQRVPSQWPRP